MNKHFKEYLYEKHAGDSAEFIFMEGATIEEVGFVSHFIDEDGDKRQLEGGITFIIKKESKVQRVILGYTELGAWLQSVDTLVG